MLVTLVARRRVRGDDPPARLDVDAAELVPERARQLAEQDRVPAPKGLQVGAVGQGDLTRTSTSPGPASGRGTSSEAQVARSVEPRALTLLAASSPRPAEPGSTKG